MKNDDICRYCIRWEGRHTHYQARCSQWNIQTQYDNFCRMFIRDTVKNREIEIENKNK